MGIIFALHHACNKIQATLDRFQEAHLWLHSMEDNYHSSDRFRWFLNVFLKALDESPDLLKRELQNEAEWKKWYKPHSEALSSDPLISFLSLKRNFVVHQNMLLPKSSGQIGITELRGMKLFLGIPISPLEDSDDAMLRYLRNVGTDDDFLGILMPDDDSIPCVFRTWQLPQFDGEVVSLCSKAWLRVGENITASLNFFGGEVPPFSLECSRHKSRGQKFQYKLYDRDELIKQAESFGN